MCTSETTRIEEPIEIAIEIELKRSNHPVCPVWRALCGTQTFLISFEDLETCMGLTNSGLHNMGGMENIYLNFPLRNMEDLN